MIGIDYKKSCFKERLLNVRNRKIFYESNSERINEGDLEEYGYDDDTMITIVLFS